jgi:predicted deacetylase
LIENLHKKAYELLPSQVKKLLSLSEYKLACLPLIYHDRNGYPPKGLDRGAVTISLDFEMAWGWQYTKNIEVDPVAKGLQEREQVPLILSKLEVLNFPATWATVGHLFLDRCSRGAGGLAHYDIPRVRPFENMNWKFASGDWYQFDPCSSVEHAPAWYAPDLIEEILSSPSGQEIACHGFSHLGFGRYCPKNVAMAELDACISAMARFGIKPKTFVFPGNEEGNFEALAEKGFLYFRSNPKWYAKINLPVRRKDDGLWRVHVSSAISRGSRWTRGERLARLKLFVDIAEKTRLAAHFWLHPSMSMSEIEEILFPFLLYCANKRDRGVLDIFTLEKMVQASETALINR